MNNENNGTKKRISHEGYIYVVTIKDNDIVMYKEDVDVWCGVTEHIRVFTVEGNTKNPVSLYRKLSKATKEVVAAGNKDWYMISVGDQKRANIYERVTDTIKGYDVQRADRYFYLYKEKKAKL